MPRAAQLLVVICLAGCMPQGDLQPAAEIAEATASMPCTPDWPASTVRVKVPGHPFAAIESRDGCWIFVSLATSSERRGAVAIVRHGGSQFALARVVPLPDAAAGMALSNDGRLLVVATRRSVRFLDVDRLVSGAARPELGSIRTARNAGSIYLALGSDDHLLFASNESINTVSAIDLEGARRNGFRQAVTVGHIPAGSDPVGLALSRDGKTLFVTSEVWRGNDAHWPGGCYAPERHSQDNRQGAIEVVDVARALLDPKGAVLAHVPAGCSPVRAVLAGDGSRLYVSARGSDAVLGFDAGKLTTDAAHALVCQVPVGAEPVGLALVDNDRKLVVANSARFSGSGGDDLTLVDASRCEQGRGAVLGTIAVGKFPRELRAVAGGAALLVTDYGSGQVELIPLANPTRGQVPAQLHSKSSLPTG